MGVRGAVEEAQRLLVRRLMASRRVVHRTMRGATVVIAQNSETAARIGRSRPGRVTVMPNATAVGRLQPWQAGRVRGKDVVFAGRLVPWKAAPLAVEAMRFVTHPEARLRLYGEGPDAARVTAAARDRGLSDRVELCGQVPREHLLRAIAGAGALVHPALHEEAGLVVAEALAMNTPVVALRRGGPAELVARYTQSLGEVVEVGNPDETARRLGAAIDRFLHLPAPAIEARGPSPTFEEVILTAYATAAEARLGT